MAEPLTIVRYYFRMAFSAPLEHNYHTREQRLLLYHFCLLLLTKDVVSVHSTPLTLPPIEEGGARFRVFWLLSGLVGKPFVTPGRFRTGLRFLFLGIVYDWYVHAFGF